MLLVGLVIWALGLLLFFALANAFLQDESRPGWHTGALKIAVPLVLAAAVTAAAPGAGENKYFLCSAVCFAGAALFGAYQKMLRWLVPSPRVGAPKGLWLIYWPELAAIYAAFVTFGFVFAAAAIFKVNLGV